jgi:hypothetical protein
LIPAHSLGRWIPDAEHADWCKLLDVIDAWLAARQIPRKCERAFRIQSVFDALGVAAGAPPDCVQALVLSELRFTTDAVEGVSTCLFAYSDRVAMFIVLVINITGYRWLLLCIAVYYYLVLFLAYLICF